MGFHTIEQGEHLAMLAEAAGFRDADTVWNAPENGDLRGLRDNPSVLAPGDTLFIPDKTSKVVDKPIDASHRFVAKGDRLKLKLRLLDFDGSPIAGAQVSLSYQGKTSTLVTDGDGVVQERIPRATKDASITVADRDLDIPLRVGELDPRDLSTGWRSRLANLGYVRDAPMTDDEDPEDEEAQEEGDEPAGSDDASTADPGADAAGDSEPSSADGPQDATAAPEGAPAAGDDEDDQEGDAVFHWRWALEEFQYDNDLPITGEPDAATLAKLEETHGS